MSKDDGKVEIDYFNDPDEEIVRKLGMLNFIHKNENEDIFFPKMGEKNYFKRLKK